MKTLKVKVNVNVSLSSETMDFISLLMTGKVAELPEKVKAEPVEKKETKAPVEATKPVAQQVVKPTAVESAKTTPPPPTKAVESAKPTESAKQSDGEHTLEEVRTLLGEKVNDHRAAIKEKLTALGAKNVSTLEPQNYDEMYNFLFALKVIANG